MLQTKVGSEDGITFSRWLSQFHHILSHILWSSISMQHSQCNGHLAARINYVSLVFLSNQLVDATNKSWLQRWLNILEIIVICMVILLPVRKKGSAKGRNHKHTHTHSLSRHTQTNINININIYIYTKSLNYVIYNL